MQTAGQVENKLKQLTKHGQSIWLDFIRRSFLEEGKLKDLVEDDGLRGVTSNPSIFEKAIAGSDDYREDLDKLVFDFSLDANGIYEKLAIADIKNALDVLKGVYTESAGRDGYVSMEVSPLLASDTKATIDEALRLWNEVDKPNLMIKVPATDEGIPAIEELISRGLNVNVTLLFDTKAYKKVAEAYMAGLEKLAANGGDLSTVASVASFFVSRIDAKVDKQLLQMVEEAEEAKDRNEAKHLQGKIAIANAKMAYEIYRELFTSERWKELVSKGARPQRLLWASTSTKNPEYPDTLYVDQLIGNETVNTLPLDTLDAFRDHGVAEETLEKNTEEAKEQLTRLESLGISLDEITDELLEEGVAAFAKSFKDLLKAVSEARREKLPSFKETMNAKLPESLNSQVEAELARWKEEELLTKLWSKDSSLFTNQDESNWLDWLDIVGWQLEDKEKFESLKAEIEDSSIEHVLLLGMGGSSLCPEVMSVTFGQHSEYPELQILDSTSPEQIAAKSKDIDLKKTVVVVASKSGTTLEPNIFMSYFYDLMKKEIGEGASTHFIAITDPGSKLEEYAKNENFKHIFYGKPEIGGRYSALSDFGMIPSTLAGIDVVSFLEKANEMVHSCRLETELADNPGVFLGLILGVAARNGLDKMTIITSDGLHDLGAWLEQLVAESTGKEGKAIIPVDREIMGSPDVYGKDRVFVYLKLENEADVQNESDVSLLETSNYPVVRITLKDRIRLGQEFFRWEIATAVAGAVIGINPFNQPDVEASKVATRALTEAYERDGSLPEETPVWKNDALSIFIDANYAQVICPTADADTESTEEQQAYSLDSIIGSHVSQIKAGDYFALLAYIEMNESMEKSLQGIRHLVRDGKKVATCLGFGPRFLHSTGQAYKGGPNTGVFIQLTCDHPDDLKVPGHSYSFGTVIDAQARGDLEVLTSRDRRALRIHLHNLEEGLEQLRQAVTDALAREVDTSEE